MRKSGRREKYVKMDDATRMQRKRGSSGKGKKVGQHQFPLTKALLMHYLAHLEFNQ